MDGLLSSDGRAIGRESRHAARSLAAHARRAAGRRDHAVAARAAISISTLLAGVVPASRRRGRRRCWWATIARSLADLACRQATPPRATPDRSRFRAARSRRVIPPPTAVALQQPRRSASTAAWSSRSGISTIRRSAAFASCRRWRVDPGLRLTLNRGAEVDEAEVLLAFLDDAQNHALHSRD